MKKREQLDRKTRRKKKQKLYIAFSFVTYLLMLGYFLFFAEMLGRSHVADTYHYNLILFKEIMRFWNYREQIGMLAVTLNLLGNVVAFVPFGMLVPVFVQRWRSLWYTGLISFELSFFVETLQLITKVGSFDVDDMFLNTVGGIVGYVLYRIVQWIRRRTNGEKKL